jgi:hypothetical protein
MMDDLTAIAFGLFTGLAVMLFIVWLGTLFRDFREYQRERKWHERNDR